MAKVKLTNLITNGNFENDMDGWNTYGTIYSTKDQCVFGTKCAVVDIENLNYCAFSKKFTIGTDVFVGHKYYVSEWIKVESIETTVVYMEICYVNSSSAWLATEEPNAFVTGQTRDWTFSSKTFTIRENPGSDFYLRYSPIKNNGTAGSYKAYADGVMLVDLTEAFGSGNEPDKDWCDKHLSYFDGTIFLEKDGYVMQNALSDPLFLFEKHPYNNWSQSHKQNPQLRNLIENGSFENGIDGWEVQNSGTLSQSSEASYVGGYSLKCVSTEVNTYGGPRLYITNLLKPSHKYYISNYALCTAIADGATWYGEIGYKKSDSNKYVGVTNINNNSKISIVNQWLKFSHYIDWFDENVSSVWYSPTRFSNNGEIDQVMYADGVILVDLTEAFGSGNEPDKDWCDKHLSYFDGIMQVGEDDYVANNLLTNGSFENGFVSPFGIVCYDYDATANSDKVSVLDSDKKSLYGTKCVSIVASNYNGTAYVHRTITNLTKNHIYYYSFMYNPVKNVTFADGSQVTMIELETTIDKTRTRVIGATGDSTEGTGYRRRSQRVELAGEENGLYFTLGKWISKTSGNIYECEIYADGWMLVDLTEAFGAGNEPDKDWCDKHLDYFDGAIAIKKDKYVLRNLIENGSFDKDVNSSLNWNSSRITLSKHDWNNSLFGDSCLKGVGTNTTTSNEQLAIYETPAIIGHIYYIIGYFNTKDMTTGVCRLTISPNSSRTDWTWLIPTSNQVQNGISYWQKLTAYYKNTSYDSLKIRYVIYKYAVDDVAYLDGCLLVDLTEAFGAGNEPDKDWCDKHLDYFDGAIAIDKYSNQRVVNNLLTNGSFETDTNSWSVNGSATQSSSNDFSLYGTKSLKCVAVDKVYSGPTRNIFNLINLSHKYYISTNILCSSLVDGNSWYAELGYYINGYKYISLTGARKTDMNTWVHASAIFAPSSDITDVWICPARLMNLGAAGDTIYCDGVMLVDLTETFGAGNEPDKQWCDDHFEYFDGSSTIDINSEMTVEDIDGEMPPHSSCLRAFGDYEKAAMSIEAKSLLPYISGHKYYVSSDIYSYEKHQSNLYFPKNTTGVKVDLANGTVSNGIIEKNNPKEDIGIWQKKSMIVSNDKIDSGKYAFGLSFNNLYNNSTKRFTNVMCIDLTAAFGEGNEPSLSWCDTYIVLDSNGTPYVKTSTCGIEYVSNNTNHITFIMKQKTKRLRTKIQSLDSSYNIIGEIKGYCQNGSLEISNSDMVRRTLDLDFVAANHLEINKNSPFWINKRLKIFAGIEDYKKNVYWFDLGVFVPTEPSTSFSLTGRTISLSAMDKMVLADNPVLMTTKIDLNTPISSAIKALGKLYGENNFMLSNNDYTLPYDYEMAAGDSIQEAIKEITNLYMNYETYYNTDGFLVFDKMKNRINDNPVWDFQNENDFSISRQISADYLKVYNDYKVYGYYDDDTAKQPSYQLTITDNTHPFSVNNMGRTHSLVIEEDNYLTEEQCKARAEYEKQQAENLINNFSIQTAPIYSLNDVNRVIKVTDNGNRYTCLVDSITYPLDVSTAMTIGCHEIFI